MKGQKPPIQVHAQALRKVGGPMAGCGSDFVLPGGDTEREDGAARAEWLDADLQRAIAAAQQAGLSEYRVEIAPDGTIAIVVTGPPSP